MKFKTAVALSLAATSTLAALLSWSASNALADGGVNVSPFYQNVTIGQYQDQADYAVTLTNNSSESLSFKLSTVNFGSLNDTGGIAFLGSSSSQFAQQHGLTSWMSLNENAVTLASGGNTQVVVTVHNSSSLSVGGHYGAILATLVNGSTAGAGSHVQVGVQQVLSSLILLVKSGGPAPDLVLQSQKPVVSGLSVPTVVNDSFVNQGDVHVVPRGLVVIKDPTGHQIMQGGMNVSSGIILPGMYRTYSTPMIKLASAWLPGNYSIDTSYEYDGSNVTKTFVSHFWYWGSVYVWMVVALAVLIGSVLWWRFGWRKWIR